MLQLVVAEKNEPQLNTDEYRSEIRKSNARHSFHRLTRSAKAEDLTMIYFLIQAEAYRTLGAGF